MFFDLDWASAGDGLAGGTGGLRSGPRFDHRADHAARKLAVEAADNALLSAELDAGIMRVKGVRAKVLPDWELAIRAASPDASQHPGYHDKEGLA